MRKPTVRWLPNTNTLHVETPLGIVNVHVGLHDIAGRRVECIEMLPNEYAGEPQVRVYGRRFVELKDTSRRRARP